jgi:high-affinity Fe2+/Pb2+ permease
MSFLIDNNSIQAHITLLQGIITRMSNYSASCKTWCITLVTAILAFTAEGNRVHLSWVCFYPILLFLLLDAYYLSMERQIVAQHRDFVNKLHNNALQVSDFFSVKMEGRSSKAIYKTFQTIGSHSIWFFYGFLTMVILLIRFWISY